MKKTALRILALVMLLALTVGALPAMAAAARSITIEPLYAGTGSYRMNIRNWSWTEEIVSVKSSNPGVLKVTDADSLEATPRKAGKATITVKYKLGGKSYTIKGKYTVKAYPNAVKSLTVNGERIKLTERRKLRYNHEAEYGKKVSVTIDLKPRAGWKITKIKAYTRDTWNSKARKTTLKVANNTKFTVPKDKEAFITYTLENGKTKFDYIVNVERYGE